MIGLSLWLCCSFVLVWHDIRVSRSRYVWFYVILVKKMEWMSDLSLYKRHALDSIQEGGSAVQFLDILRVDNLMKTYHISRYIYPRYSPPPSRGCWWSLRIFSIHPRTTMSVHACAHDGSSVAIHFFLLGMWGFGGYRGSLREVDK